jgi:(1->4)-alpha-D-glucan 1-alpha-D-glucosylmutase
MRILALAELAQDWAQAVRSWTTMNAPLIEQQARRRAPSRAHEYMLYQALIGAWQGEPDQSFVERMQGYAIKAAREGKQETSWANPDDAYENALTGFIARLLDPKQSRAFIDHFAVFAERAGRIGALNSLSQLALKATIPGVPDFYQGTEQWDLSLVDPDNRRPVDFDARHQALETLELSAQDDGWREGRQKFALTKALLSLRAAQPALFADGDYKPITVEGAGRDHVIAFARIHKADAVIVAVGRQFAPLTDGGRQGLKTGAWDGSLDLSGYRVARNLLSNTPLTVSGKLPLTDIFNGLAVAVLQAQTTD